MSDEQEKRPSDFYFAVGADPFELHEMPVVVVTSRHTWDEATCLDSDYRVPADVMRAFGFPELMECIYELTCAPGEAKSKLMDAGFHHNQDILKL